MFELLSEGDNRKEVKKKWQGVCVHVSPDIKLAFQEIAAHYQKPLVWVFRRMVLQALRTVIEDDRKQGAVQTAERLTKLLERATT